MLVNSFSPLSDSSISDPLRQYLSMNQEETVINIKAPIMVNNKQKIVPVGIVLIFNC